MPTFKESSRKGFNEDKITHDGVRTGALQRIADACELMAKDRQELISDSAYYQNLSETRLKRIVELEKEVRNLKQVKTRFHNQLKKTKDEKAPNSNGDN